MPVHVWGCYAYYTSEQILHFSSAEQYSIMNIPVDATRLNNVFLTLGH